MPKYVSFQKSILPDPNSLKSSFLKIAAPDHERSAVLSSFDTVLARLDDSLPAAMSAVQMLSDRIYTGTFIWRQGNDNSLNNVLQTQLGGVWIKCAAGLVSLKRPDEAIEMARQGANRSLDGSPINTLAAETWQNMLKAKHRIDRDRAEGLIVAAHGLLDPFSMSFGKAIHHLADNLDLDVGKLVRNRRPVTVSVFYHNKVG